MAPRRMAAGRKRADQILALDPAGGDRPRDTRGNRQTALADRARLSGTQAGTRARSLRRTRLARLSPPHGALRRSLRIPGLRTESDSPLRRQNPGHQNVWPIRRFSTPRIPRSEQNATSNRPSQASALGWPEVSPGDCPDAPVAKEPTCDTVRLRRTGQVTRDRLMERQVYARERRRGAGAPKGNKNALGNRGGGRKR